MVNPETIWLAFQFSTDSNPAVRVSAILLSIFFSMTFKQATDDLDDDDGVHIKYRMDSSLLNLRHIKARTKTRERMWRDLIFGRSCSRLPHRASYAAHHVMLCDRLADVCL